MHKRQLKKNKWIICTTYAFLALNFLCFGIHQHSLDSEMARYDFGLAAISLAMVFVQYFDHREEMNSRGYVYGMLVMMSALTVFFLHIVFSWWITLLFVAELGILIALTIRFRPVA